jgi:hypothetical protein
VRRSRASALGAAFAAACAARQGTGKAAYTDNSQGPGVAPEQAGQAITGLSPAPPWPGCLPASRRGPAALTPPGHALHNQATEKEHA